MSSIEKMSIQGIRSFGPDDKDKQIINFFSPLTLILGPNGTGKTTVIECLKYMTTGEMPPGSRQGGAFIHDPKVAHEREVKAQVRLQFRDVRSQMCIAQRSLVATQKAKKVEMKTLDSTITRRLPDNTKQSISSRCAEMDREQTRVEMKTDDSSISRLKEDGTYTKPNIISRCTEMNCEQTRVEMKTLDSTIKRKKEDGTKQLTYYSVNEISQEMVALLGVAKPVLENVIFCHQEEANWPLSEGKALKQKFDDIFASTRYVKALEAIRKFRQEQRGQIQMFTGEIKYLKQNKEKAAEIKVNLDDTESRYIASKDKVKEIEEGLKPVEDKLKQLNSKSNAIYQLHTKIEKMKSGKLEMEKSLKELRDKIENEFEGTTDQLKQALADFESKVKEREKKLTEYEDKMTKLVAEANRLSERKGELLLEQGKLEHEAEQNKKRIEKRDALIRSVAQEYDMADCSGTIAEPKVKQFLKELEEKAKHFMTAAKTTREKYEEKESNKQKELDMARSNKTKLETELRMKADKIKENMEEIKILNQKLSEVDASGERLKDIERDLRRANAELVEAEKSVSVDSLKSEVSELQKQKSELDANLKILDTEMNKLSLESNARTQLDVFKKDKTTKDEQMRRLKNKNEDSIQHLLGRMPSDNLKRAIDEHVADQAGTLNQERGAIQRVQRTLTETETNRKMTVEQLAKKEEELKGHQEELMEVCESQNFDEGLNILQEKLSKQQDLKGTLEGSVYLYKSYRKSLVEKAHPACPLCHRDFDTQDDVDTLAEELDHKLNLVPEKLGKVTKAIGHYEEQKNKMLGLKPVRATMEKLQSHEIPQLKTKISSYSKQIEKLKTELEEKEEALESLETDESMAKALLGDAMMIDRYHNEIRDLDRKIAAQSAKLSDGDSDRTMQQVTQEREDIQEQLENVNRNLDRKRQKISEHSERLQRLKSTVIELKNEKVQKESDLQQRQHWEAQKQELVAEKDTLKIDVQDAKEQLRPLQDRIDRLLGEKDKLTQEKDQRFDQDKDRFTKIRDRGKEVGTFQKEIERFMLDGGRQKLAETRTKMSEIEKTAQQGEQQRGEVGGQIERIRKDLDTQRMRKRELDDNYQLRRKQKEIQNLDMDIEEEDEKLGGLDVTNLEREKKKLHGEQERLVADKNTALGRQRGHEEEIRRFKKELKDDMYKDADAKYRNKLIALRTTELANDDLDKYYKALDRSIMSYHRLKMDEINKIIRELWRNTYKGNDIETIEIRSDEDDSGASGAAKTRRSYHYRVVMIKGDTALDMRGRCSAGQKVLASLIIRLALAETFCLNCGILALDEPTTNLDRENIESLAWALVEIIRSRSKQRNFQLLVITHDEDFVELLGRSDYVDEFYKVGKNPEGCSKLSKAKVEDLHH